MGHLVEVECLHGIAKALGGGESIHAHGLSVAARSLLDRGVLYFRPIRYDI